MVWFELGGAKRVSFVLLLLVKAGFICIIIDDSKRVMFVLYSVVIIVNLLQNGFKFFGTMNFRVFWPREC
jgi:hypothetical protein